MSISPANITYGDIGRGSPLARALKWGSPLLPAKIGPYLETVQDRR